MNNWQTIVIDKLTNNSYRQTGSALLRSVIDFDEMAGGLNKRRMIQSAVFKELVKVRTCDFFISQLIQLAHLLRCLFMITNSPLLYIKSQVWNRLQLKKIFWLVSLSWLVKVVVKELMDAEFVELHYLILTFKTVV